MVTDDGILADGNVFWLVEPGSHVKSTTFSYTYFRKGVKKTAEGVKRYIANKPKQKQLKIEKDVIKTVVDLFYSVVKA